MSSARFRNVAHCVLGGGMWPDFVAAGNTHSLRLLVCRCSRSKTAGGMSSTVAGLPLFVLGMPHVARSKLISSPIAFIQKKHLPASRP